jgi:hypothetical protein
MACWISVAHHGIGQAAGNGIAAEQIGIGQLEARVEKYDRALGVVSQLNRPPPSSVECNGVCYFVNSTKPIAWKCAPKTRCDLYCTVSPPVGGCD